MKEFITKVLEAGKFEGCMYQYLDDHYAVVFAWDEEYGLMGKVAYNCDDLQCDYDIDWLLPQTKSEDICYVEIANCQHCSAEDLARDFKEYYRRVLENDKELI